jgi:hypothetical protein
MTFRTNAEIALDDYYPTLKSDVPTKDTVYENVTRLINLLEAKEDGVGGKIATNLRESLDAYLTLKSDVPTKDVSYESVTRLINLLEAKEDGMGGKIATNLRESLDAYMTLNLEGAELDQPPPHLEIE